MSSCLQINAEKNNNADRSIPEETPGRKASSKKSHRSAKLLRPVSIEATARASILLCLQSINNTKKVHFKVICICNDLYAPALRQLRQVAK
jgi:chromosome transmission fidelity protein 18